MSFTLKAQKSSVHINAKLNPKNNFLKVQQKIVYYNKSNDTLSSIYLHNWANSFKNNKTPLGKRFIDDYEKDFYFANEKDKGYSKIHNLAINYKKTFFKELKNQPDIIKIALNKPLIPKDSITISATYTIKIPSSKFTGYGKTKTGYHLRFWYLSPAVYTTNWQLMSNLNMDDLYQDIADFSIDIDVPKNYIVESNLYQYENKLSNKNNYYLVGKNKKDIIIHIDKKKRFKYFQTKNTQIKTDIFDEKINYYNAKKIISREVEFIENFIGKHPNLEILVDANTVNKNSLQEIYGLPKWLKPYPENFHWEIHFFKALTSKYIDDVLLLNKRNDYWLNNGIKTFLMMEYIKKYYPNITVLGKFSKIWGLRKYNLAKLKQNDKFSFLYQFSARKFYDQPLTMQSDSLSNFNRKVISQYKAGLGLKYLQDYVGDSILKNSLKEFYHKQKLKIGNSKIFAKILQSKTTKNLQWFFKDYLQTNKKIDYTIKDAIATNDSIYVTIKNKSNFTAPIALYGVKNKKIIFKKWFTNIDSVSTFSIKKGKFDRLSLNYENLYPEHNTLDNWKSIKKRLFNKPIQFRFLKDIEDPYYHQIYFQPEFRYNYYDGIMITTKLHNKPVIPRNFTFNVSPSYSTKNGSVTGRAGLSYSKYGKPNNTIYKTNYSLLGSYLHYNNNLIYKSFSPSISIEFKRNSLRDVGGKFLSASLITIDKETPNGKTATDQDKYTLLNFKYFNSKPNIIKGTQYSFGAEIANKFSKLTAEFRYKKLTGLHRQIEFRVFSGLFLNNISKGNYFSFGLDRATDYLFQLNYYGRSENSGFFSQQFVMAEGGFKSKLNTRFANQYMLSLNSNIGIWRWAEVYNDLAFLKNKGKNIYAAYENGIRFNFIPGIFELYFPIYSNNGWEINQKKYPEKIRFVLTTNVNAIYNFFRRGLL